MLEFFILLEELNFFQILVLVVGQTLLLLLLFYVDQNTLLSGNYLIIRVGELFEIAVGLIELLIVDYKVFQQSQTFLSNFFALRLFPEQFFQELDPLAGDEMSLDLQILASYQHRE